MQRFQQRLSLRIGSSLTVGTCLMSSVISDMETICPKMEIYSFVSNTAEIEQKLLRKELDAAVVEGTIESPKLTTIPIVEDSLVLVCGKNHDFYPKNVVHASELEGRKFAVREKGSGTRKLFEQYLSAHNIHIQTSWEANCPRTILNAVIHNNALAVISQRLLRHEIRHRSVKIFHYETGEWDRCFKLVYLKKGSENTDKINTLPHGTYPSPCIENLRTVLERYRTLDHPEEFPACILKNDI